MPLEVLPTRSYLDRKVLRVSSRDRNEAKSRSATDFVVDLDQEIQNVVSIELVGWNWSSHALSTFIGRYDSVLGINGPGVERSIIPGRSRFLIRVFDVGGVNFVDLPVDMENANNTTYDYSFANWVVRVAQLDDAIAASVQAALAQFGNAFVNDANTNFTVAYTGDNRLAFNFFTDPGATPLRSQIRFTSDAPGSDDSAASVLGFDDGEIYTSTGVSETLTAPYEINEQVDRYLNVYVGEAAEFSPLAKVFVQRISNGKSYFRAKPAFRPRILTDPVRKMSQIQIRLTAGDDERIPSTVDPDFDFTFHVLYLRPVSSAVSWAKEGFLM